MEITVKEVRVLKTGTTKSGDWELIKVTSEDDTGYTTFDKKAKSLTGATIEFDPVIKEGKLSFKDFKVISEGQVSPPPEAKPIDSQMSKEDRSDKQRVERASIEAQTAYKGIPELVATLAEHPKSKLALAAERWAMLKLGGVAELPTQTITPPPDATAKTEELFSEPLLETPEAPTEPPEGKTGSLVDLEWLKEQLGMLRGKGREEWNEANLLSYMKTTYQDKDSKTTLVAACKLSKNQAAHFTKKVQEAIDKL